MTFDEAHTAIKKGDIISLRHALDDGMMPDLPNQFSWTPLMLAAIEGNTAIAELLVSKGADLNKTNNFGDTALSLAACGGHVQLVNFLRKNGASVDCQPHGTSLQDWIKVSSGLSGDKIRVVLDLILGRDL